MTDRHIVEKKMSQEEYCAQFGHDPEDVPQTGTEKRYGTSTGHWMDPNSKPINFIGQTVFVICRRCEKRLGSYWKERQV